MVNVKLHKKFKNLRFGLLGFGVFFKDIGF